jgi:hypothetical protein
LEEESTILDWGVSFQKRLKSGISGGKRIWVRAHNKMGSTPYPFTQKAVFVPGHFFLLNDCFVIFKT